jgi:hypothetical protein
MVLNGKGESCLLATEMLERSLGQVASRKLLPEFEGDAESCPMIEQVQTIQQPE